MKFSSPYLLFLLLFFNHTSQAECLTDMPMQILMDCITIESTGENYQQWKAAIASKVEQEENKNIIADNSPKKTKSTLESQ